MEPPPDEEEEEPPSAQESSYSRQSRHEEQSENTEPAEMTALRLELSTLSTSHASIQSTLHLLQTQLNDLKRVNNELQEENESYNILLRERTMSGQFDIMRTAGNASGEVDDDDDAEEMDGVISPVEEDRSGRPVTTRSRSTLDVVLEEIPSPAAALRREGSPSSRNSKRSRRGAVRTGSPVLRGESLADLPVAGPGLDLAAELGRAVNKDILEGRVDAPQYIPPHPTTKVDPAEVQSALVYTWFQSVLLTPIQICAPRLRPSKTRIKRCRFTRQRSLTESSLKRVSSMFWQPITNPNPNLDGKDLWPGYPSNPNQNRELYLLSSHLGRTLSRHIHRIQKPLQSVPLTRDKCLNQPPRAWLNQRLPPQPLHPRRQTWTRPQRMPPRKRGRGEVCPWTGKV